MMPEVKESAVKVEAESTESIKPEANRVPENGVSSTSPEKQSPDKNDAEVLLAQGKRHLFIKDYPNAVATLGDACAKFSEMYGDLGDECAEAYFNYGRALLELAREENNVLGAEPEKEDDEEEEEEDKDEGEDQSETKSNEKELDKNESIDKKETEEENERNKIVADETVDTNEGVNEEGEDKDEDVDNLQLAWEVFELAKKIYERQKADAKLAETYLYLGEVGLESENYNNAIEDMKRCVEIQEQILPADHRDIAETYFQLGIACSLCNEFDQAVIYFKRSCQILENRIQNLVEKGAPEAETEKNPFYSVEKEIAEIKTLLPEIKTKIADMEDYKQETMLQVMKTIKEKTQSSDEAGPSSSFPSVPIANGNTPKPATDISHLVRKKRKPEDESSAEKNLKKACTDEINK